MHHALLRQKLNTLAAVKGRHTELISLYVPSHKRICDVIAYLNKESTASANIQDKLNRKAVLSGISALIS